MPDRDAHGPIDFVLLEFSGDQPLDAPAAALLDLVDAGTIRLYDIAVLRTASDGTFEAVEIGAAGALGALAGAQSGLLNDEDLAMAAGAMQPGMTAALIVYENSWAGDFVAAARDAGGEMVATARIPAQDVIDALDSLED